MEKHLQIRLIAQTATRGKRAGSREIILRYPNGDSRRRSGATRPFRSQPRYGSSSELARSLGLLKAVRNEVLVRFPPACFLGFAFELQSFLGCHGLLPSSLLIVKLNEPLSRIERSYHPNAMLIPGGHNHWHSTSARRSQVNAPLFAFDDVHFKIQGIIEDHLLGLLRRDPVAFQMPDVRFIPVELDICHSRPASIVYLLYRYSSGFGQKLS